MSSNTDEVEQYKVNITYQVSDCQTALHSTESLKSFSSFGSSFELEDAKDESKHGFSAKVHSSAINCGSRLVSPLFLEVLFASVKGSIEQNNAQSSTHSKQVK